MNASPQGCIVVDWGTSNLRARRLDARGVVIARRDDERGIATLDTGGHEAVLRSLIGDWLTDSAPVIAFGMVTSRNGWIEVPYVPCPFDAAALAAASVSRTLDDGVRIHFVPGARDDAATPFPDVMRGEETQLVGCDARGLRTVVLPGTHSKWARLEGDTVTGFRTMVTGELHALLLEHAFVARGGDGESDPGVFIDAVTHARTAPEGLSSALFAARTGLLAGRLTGGDVGEYLSGTLIGHEFRAALAAGFCEPGESVLIVASQALATRYARAATVFGVETRIDPGEAGTRGALAIARQSGSLPPTGARTDVP